MHPQPITGVGYTVQPGAMPLEARQIDTLAALGICQTFAANAEIVAEGARATHLYKVISGAVRTVQLMEDGRRQIVSIYLPGDVVGLSVRDAHRLAVEAMNDCAVIAIQRDRLAAARVGNTGLADTLYDMTVLELERADERLTTLGRRTALERIAWLLLDIAGRLDAGNTFELPMCRQDMGDFLGLTIETVSRMMTDLERRGIISLPTSRRVVMNDREALEDLRG